MQGFEQHMRGTIPWSEKLIEDIAFLEGDAEVGKFGNTSMLKDGGELRVVRGSELYARADRAREEGAFSKGCKGNTGQEQAPEKGEKSKSHAVISPRASTNGYSR